MAVFLFGMKDQFHELARIFFMVHVVSKGLFSKPRSPEVSIYLFPLACGSGKDGMMPTMTLSFDKQLSVSYLIGFLGEISG